jgi:hypothetical protein
MSKKCSQNQIERSAYTRKTKNKTLVKVKANCIEDRGKKGKGPYTLPPITNNLELSRYGYSLKKSQQSRRKSLRDASKKNSALPVLRRVNLIRNYSKSYPANYTKLSADVEYMKKYYARIKKTSSKKKSRKLTLKK